MIHATCYWCGAAIAHISECSECLDLIADRLWVQLEAAHRRSTKPEQRCV